MRKRSSQGGYPQHRRQSETEVTPPLIPLQEGVQQITPLRQVVQPLIPLQLSSQRAKLQHELSHATRSLPNPASVAPPQATKISRRRLRKRQDILLTTTITDANIAVINASGSTITVETIINVPTGSIAITLPSTTITIEPLASYTGGTITYPAGNTQSLAPSVPTIPSNSAPVPTSTNSAQTQSTLPISGTLLPSSAVISSGPSTSGVGGIQSPSIPTSTTLPTSTTSIPSTLSSSNISSTIVTAASSMSLTNSSTYSTQGPVSIHTSLNATSSYGSLSSTSSHTSLSTSNAEYTTHSSATPSSTSNPPAATTTAAAAASGGSTVNVPVVGGVVGGLAGLALLLGLLLLLMRWWRKRRSESMMLRSIDDEVAPPEMSQSNAPMTQNPVTSGAAAAAVGGAAAGSGLGAMIKRMTGGSTATSDTAPSEKGFQNFGGRKLESVLLSGGDGYGEPSAPGTQTPSSFSRGWAERFPYETPSRHSSMIVGPATPYRRPSSSIAELSSSRPDSDTLRTMPISPRPPATSSAWPLTNTSAGIPVPPSLSSEASDSMLPLPAPRAIDPLGRSRYSQDGSRNSKFTEGL